MILIKIGGGTGINLNGIAADLAQLREPFIIIHGANAARDALAERLGLSKRVVTSVSGYSSVFSDPDAIDLLMMAYAGLRNKRIVELCQQHGINAVGLTGLDGRLIQGRRNQGLRVREEGRTRIVRDLSGKPERINVSLLQTLMDHGYAPVLTVPIIDETSTAINSENDDITALVAREIGADLVVQLIEAPGFMRVVGDPSSLIPDLSPEEVSEWEMIAEGRIKRKLHALGKLLEYGVRSVIIADGRRERPVLDALEGLGTRVGESHSRDLQGVLRQPPLAATTG